MDPWIFQKGPNLPVHLKGLVRSNWLIRERVPVFYTRKIPGIQLDQTSIKRIFQPVDFLDTLSSRMFFCSNWDLVAILDASTSMLQGKGLGLFWCKIYRTGKTQKIHVSKDSFDPAGCRLFCEYKMWIPAKKRE